ncbi:chaplin [Streptomyces sp. NPDC058989]|uniref:chaplin n=1 Tax=Streptomyces sp. NPDC058989 TaxID=3346686 RepID=UPI0036795032
MRARNVIASIGLAAAALLASAGGAAAHDGADANGKAVKSPGVGSGNLVQAPVHVPVNAVGNTATVIGGLNPTFANDGFNG